jgi:3-oxoacyl-[acyl-carrier-protein] synthase II
MLACHISIIHDAQGPNNTITAGDTSGIQAIGEASRIIQRGDADIMLAGAAESKVHPLTIVRQNLLGNLSLRSDEPQKASRPFEKDRDGLVLAEGAGVVALEEIFHAQKRGAKIYGEVVGFGSASSATPPTRMDADGSGLARSIKAALDDGGLTARDVNCIFAHGLSCLLSDVIETRAIKEALGERARQIPISAIKSMTGHCGAASGAIEFIAAVLALENAQVPPTINYEKSDPECDLDYVPNQARELEPEVALVNCFGFGGQNSTLVLREFK